MKVITVSQKFPAYHPKAGQPTHFVEKICKSFYVDAYGIRFFEDIMSNINELNKSKPYNIVCDFKKSIVQANDYLPKHHTIRAGHRFKTGEMASLRVWSGKPYNAPQIEFAQVKVKCYNIYIDENLSFFINDNLFAYSSSTEALTKFALNDGLELGEMFHWFKLTGKKNKPFTGQIICWNESIKY